MEVFQHLQAAGVTLNKANCEFTQNQVTFLGQIVNHSGISPDPEKVRAAYEFPAPRNIRGICRFLRMVNQLSTFSPHLSHKTKPLRELLKKDRAWLWSDLQQQVFDDVKTSLTTTPVLAMFDQKWETIVSADALLYGLSAVLLQQQQMERQNLSHTTHTHGHLPNSALRKLRKRHWP